MATQVQEIKNMAIKLKSLGYPLSEEFQTIAVLTALPSEWNTIHDIILNKTGKFSLHTTIDALLEHKMVLRWRSRRKGTKDEAIKGKLEGQGEESRISKGH